MVRVLDSIVSVQSTTYLELPNGPIDRIRDGFDKEPRRIDPHPLEDTCTNVSYAMVIVIVQVFKNEYELRKNNLKTVNGPYVRFYFGKEVNEILTRVVGIFPI